MKLEIEIKNDMVEYKYHFSEGDNGGGSMPLTQGLLATFVNATHYMQTHYMHEHDKIMSDIKCKGWIERNPLLYVEMLERIAQKEPKK